MRSKRFPQRQPDRSAPARAARHRRPRRHVDARIPRPSCDQQHLAAGERVLVCVGPDPLSARLVRSARRLATALHADWLAVYVETPALLRLSRQARDRVLQTLKLAESLGAETENLSGESVASDNAGLRAPAQRQQDHRRQPARGRWHDRFKPSLVDEIVRGSGDIDVYVISGEPGAGKRRAATLAEAFEQISGVPARRHRGRRSNAGVCPAQPSCRAHQPGHAVPARYGSGGDPFRTRAIGPGGRAQRDLVRFSCSWCRSTRSPFRMRST